MPSSPAELTTGHHRPGCVSGTSHAPVLCWQSIGQIVWGEKARACQRTRLSKEAARHCPEEEGGIRRGAGRKKSRKIQQSSITEKHQVQGGKREQ